VMVILLPGCGVWCPLTFVWSVYWFLYWWLWYNLWFYCITGFISDLQN
jgi:hypothetical protein